MAPIGKLQGKVALVSGGAGEIGSEVCLGLAKEGASVVVVDLASGDQLTSKIADAGGKAISVQTDLSKTAEVVAAFDKAVEIFGAVHIVVNLVGITIESPTFQTTSDEDWDRIFLINCKGSFLVAREAAKRLGPGGRIVLTQFFACSEPKPWLRTLLLHKGSSGVYGQGHVEGDGGEEDHHKRNRPRPGEHAVAHECKDVDARVHSGACGLLSNGKTGRNQGHRSVGPLSGEQ